MLRKQSTCCNAEFVRLAAEIGEATMKKVIIFLIILAAGGGGVYYWKFGQAATESLAPESATAQGI